VELARHGTIIRAAQDDFVLINADSTVTLSYSSVKKIKSPMDPRRRSAIVGLVVLGGLMGNLAGGCSE
jgi:hypothetical protein